MVKDDKRVPYRFGVLNSESIGAIHEATLEVLAETGALFEDDEAVELLASAGASVNNRQGG